MRVLLTGGTGYIGGHAAVALARAGHEPVLFDNGSNSLPGAHRAIEALTGRGLELIEADVRDARALDAAFEGHAFDAVLHLAGDKAAGESVRAPERCYANNVGGTATLIERMQAHGVKRLVFSSSAAVYAGASTPLDEDSPTDPGSPYGRSKLMAETMLGDLPAADPDWRIAVLRYFNAGGASPGGGLTDGLWGRSTNLIPRLVEAACGYRECIEVYGDDWPTWDGTCVRDYVHVVDIACAHVAALGRLADTPGLTTVNLGSGQGHSVLEVVRAFQRASGCALPVRLAGRRPGDVAVACADPTRAWNELGWRATRGLDRICTDAWGAAAEGAPEREARP